jgi:hypothetical protein
MKSHPSGKSALPLSQREPAVRGLLVAVVAWSLAWKGTSLWRAAKDDKKLWFVTLLASNTLGILDAIYIFRVSPARRRAARDEDSILTSTGEAEQLGHTEES